MKNVNILIIISLTHVRNYNVFLHRRDNKSERVHSIEKQQRTIQTDIDNNACIAAACAAVRMHTARIREQRARQQTEADNRQ